MFHKNLGATRSSDIPKGGVKISNSDMLHSSKHKKMSSVKKSNKDK